MVTLGDAHYDDQYQRNHFQYAGNLLGIENVEKRISGDQTVLKTGLWLDTVQI